MRFASMLLGVLALSAPAHAQDCAHDDALSRAALVLLSGDERPDAAQLQRTVRAEGSDLPHVLAHVHVDGDSEAAAGFLRRAHDRWRAPLACGEARSEGRVLTLVSPAAGRLEVAPHDRLIVRLAEGFDGSRVELRDREGRVHREAVRRGDVVSPPPDFEQPITVQLIAEGPDGPRPVSERTIGNRAPTVVVDSDEPLTARLSRLRERTQAGALRPNRLLARVARGHAERTCASGHVSHLDQDGDPEARLAREGIVARHVGETIARAESPSRGWYGMLESPSHRAALSDARFTDVGVAEVDDGHGHTCQVVLLAAWPRAVPYSP